MSWRSASWSCEHHQPLPLEEMQKQVSMLGQGYQKDELMRDILDLLVVRSAGLDANGQDGIAEMNLTLLRAETGEIDPEVAHRYHAELVRSANLRKLSDNDTDPPDPHPGSV